MKYHSRVIELNCKELSKRLLDQVKKETLVFVNKGNRAPSLAVVLVGDDIASQSYVKSKAKRCMDVGFMHFQYSLSEDSLESDVISLIEKLNDDENIDAILVQLPLPEHISKDNVIAAIKPEKDADGFTSRSLGLLAMGKPSIIPCTPLGIIKILENWNIETRGKRVCIIGRSTIVGKPLSMLLSNPGYDATVTLCNSYTPDLKAITLESDIIITAAGRPSLIDSTYVKDGSVVIDVGINRVEDRNAKKGYRLTGDADFKSFENRDVMITPVPGGVGLMTVAALMMNTLSAARRRDEISN